MEGKLSQDLKPQAIISYENNQNLPYLKGLKLGDAIKTILTCPKKTTAISFSGGKDSLVILDLAYNLGYYKAVFSNTTIEFEETLDYVKRITKFYPKLNLKIVQSLMDFQATAQKLGFPSRRYRWCCDVFKFAPLGKYAKENGIKHFLTGLRSTESNRRHNYLVMDKNPLFQAKQINPIISWTDEDVWSYIWYEKKLPVNPLYRQFSRIGCWCCPYNSNNDWELLETYFPEKMANLGKHLTELSKIHIKKEHRELYLSGLHWTAWRYKGEHKKSFLMGLCGIKDNMESFFVALQNEEEVFRVKEILPIITDDYKIIKTKILARLDNAHENQVRILAEKAANCIGCGSCTLLCKKNALVIKSNEEYGFYLSVDPKKCNKCFDCLKTSHFRGACVSRNYSTSRSAIVKE